jgi:hypothetical protein
MYLEDFKTEVIQNEGKYRVIYTYDNFSGTCDYDFHRSGNRIKQNVLLLSNVDMGDIIERIHQDTPLKSEDLTNMSMNIRNHSLGKVEEFISQRGPH